MAAIKRLGLLLAVLCGLCFKTGESECRNKYSWCSGVSNGFCENIQLYRVSCPESCGLCNNTDTCREDLGCEYDCTSPAQSTRVCTCADGFRLNGDGKTCSDIDECLQSNICVDPTQPMCVNTLGSFYCTGTCSEIPGTTNYYNREECCTLSSNITGCGQNMVTGVHGPSGPDATLALWPWTILVKVGDRLCTGVLISNEWIITAAHCFSSWRSGSPITAWSALRSTFVNDSNFNTQQSMADQVVVHHNFDFPNNDIALVHLERTISTSSLARPICLPNGEVPREGERCWLSGYEALFYEHGVERVLTDSSMHIASNSVCSKNLGRLGEAIDSHNSICAEYNASMQVQCPGETSGVLVCQRCTACEWYVAGIMSFGDVCSISHSFGSFVAIESYEDWISEHTSITIRKDGTCASSSASWRPWGKWSSCTRTCGGGSRSRSRSCWNGQRENSSCSGNGAETAACNRQQCPRWSKYSSWSQCSETCGNGQRSRRRHCIGGAIGQIGCHQGSTETQVCHETDCPHWSSWSSWSECSRTCDVGERRSNRRCIGNGNNSTCEGSAIRTTECRERTCPSCTNWSGWNACSLNCNRGFSVRTRTRNCSSQNKQNELETKICPGRTCYNQWNDWSAWTECSNACGSGKRSRSRRCPDNGHPERINCRGLNRRVQNCIGTSCKKDKARCQELNNIRNPSYCQQNLVWCIRNPAFMRRNCALTCCTHGFI